MLLIQVFYLVAQGLWCFCLGYFLGYQRCRLKVRKLPKVESVRVSADALVPVQENQIPAPLSWREQAMQYTQR